jgi:hypothetical protein
MLAAMGHKGIDPVEIHCYEADKKSGVGASQLAFSLARAEDVEIKAPVQVGRRTVWLLDQGGRWRLSFI